MSTVSDPWSTAGRVRGFTLIEVIGALVIFSVGVLSVMRVGGSLSTQMRYAGTRSELVVLAAERVDSIESMPFDSIQPGTVSDTVTVQGWTYLRTVVVTSVTPVLAKVDVDLVRAEGSGPMHAVTSYTSAAW